MIEHIFAKNERVAVVAERSAYQSPRLSLLGNVCSLTETGSMEGMEDWVENGTCMLFGIGVVNMTYNMC